MTRLSYNILVRGFARAQTAGNLDALPYTSGFVRDQQDYKTINNAWTIRKFKPHSQTRTCSKDGVTPLQTYSSEPGLYSQWELVF